MQVINVGMWIVQTGKFERGKFMDCMSIFLIVTIVIALMVSIITSVIYVVAIFKLGKCMEKLLDEKEE